MADVTGASAANPSPPSAPSPAINGNGTENGAQSPAVAGSGVAAAASPASASTPTTAAAPRPAGMSEAQKQEMVKSFSPDKIANFKKVRHKDQLETCRTDMVDAGRHAGCGHDEREFNQGYANLQPGRLAR